MNCRSRGFIRTLKNREDFNLRLVTTKKCHCILGTLAQVREKGDFSM